MYEECSVSYCCLFVSCRLILFKVREEREKNVPLSGRKKSNSRQAFYFGTEYNFLYLTLAVSDVVRQRPVYNQGRGRFLPVNEIIFSRQSLREIVFFFVIWLELYGVLGVQYYFFLWKSVMFFSQKNLPPWLSTGRCLTILCYVCHYSTWFQHWINISLLNIHWSNFFIFSLLLVCIQKTVPPTESYPLLKPCINKLVI